jgi:hypothetical protein
MDQRPTAAVAFGLQTKIPRNITLSLNLIPPAAAASSRRRRITVLDLRPATGRAIYKVLVLGLGLGYVLGVCPGLCPGGVFVWGFCPEGLSYTRMILQL